MSNAIPSATVIANPTIADHAALPRREASAYKSRCRKRTTAYVIANSRPSVAKAWGIAKPAMKMNAVATRRQRRSDLESAGLGVSRPDEGRPRPPHQRQDLHATAEPGPAQLT